MKAYFCFNKREIFILDMFNSSWVFLLPLIPSFFITYTTNYIFALFNIEYFNDVTKGVNNSFGSYSATFRSYASDLNHLKIQENVIYETEFHLQFLSNIH